MCDLGIIHCLKIYARGGSRTSGKGVHMYKGGGWGFSLLILSHFS